MMERNGGPWDEEVPAGWQWIIRLVPLFGQPRNFKWEQDTCMTVLRWMTMNTLKEAILERNQQQRRHEASHSISTSLYHASAVDFIDLQDLPCFL